MVRWAGGTAVEAMDWAAAEVALVGSPVGEWCMVVVAKARAARVGSQAAAVDLTGVATAVAVAEHAAAAMDLVAAAMAEEMELRSVEAARVEWMVGEATVAVAESRHNGWGADFRQGPCLGSRCSRYRGGSRRSRNRGRHRRRCRHSRTERRCPHTHSPVKAVGLGRASLERAVMLAAGWADAKVVLVALAGFGVGAGLETVAG